MQNHQLNVKDELTPEEAQDFAGRDLLVTPLTADELAQLQTALCWGAGHPFSGYVNSSANGMPQMKAERTKKPKRALRFCLLTSQPLLARSPLFGAFLPARSSSLSCLKELSNDHFF